MLATGSSGPSPDRPPNRVMGPMTRPPKSFDASNATSSREAGRSVYTVYTVSRRTQVRSRTQKCPEGTAARPLMQSLVLLAAPSGQPKNMSGGSATAIPLLHELRCARRGYPQVVHSCGNSGKLSTDEQQPRPGHLRLHPQQRPFAD